MMAARPAGKGKVAWKPNVLAIVPPYTVIGPPAGAAALLGYLRAIGCEDFDFVDLRLAVPSVFAPTYRSIGAFGETYVMDVPDLPLVLTLLKAAKSGTDLFAGADDTLERYCAERLIGVDALAQYLTGMERYLRNALAQLPDLRFVGFSVWTSNYLTTLMAAAILKQRPHPPTIVAGGPQVTESTASARLGLEAGLFDAVVQGEGEEKFAAIYQSFRRGGVIGPIPGVMTAASHPHPTMDDAPPPLLKLRNLPAPNYDAMDLAAYALSPDSTTVLYQLSRGCTDRCTFCSEWVFWQRFRSIEPSQAVEQLAEMQHRYGFSDVLFTDSLLNGSIKRLREFGEGLLERNIKVQWGGFMRAQMDAETLSVLKRAGLKWVNIGIESMSDDTLSLMNKRRTESDNLGALRQFLEHGIVVQSGLIPGFPGDTRAKFLYTVKQLRALKKEFPALLSFTNEPFTISPAQAIYKALGAFGLEPIAWSGNYLDIAPEHRAITESVLCSVTGSNQGVERMGESALIPYFDGGMSPATPFSYSLIEKFSARELEIESIEGGWVLARCRTSSGLLYGCILTEDERLQYLQAIEQPAPDSLNASSILEVPAIVALLRKVERNHMFPADRELPSLFPIAQYLPLMPTTMLTLSPYVVGRILPNGKEPELVLANLVATRAVIVSAGLAPLLKYLRKAPRSVASVGRYARRTGVAITAQEWFMTAENLWSQGFLVSISASTARPARPDNPSAVTDTAHLPSELAVLIA
ncbi:MAG: radical SAM protein [Betaproteobacteria bacterium]